MIKEINLKDSSLSETNLKVSEKFLDKEFIHNDKEGYYI